MPGQPFTITIDDTEVRAALARLAQRATDTLPAMQDIGRALENLTEDAFAAEGPGWPALTPAYVRRRGEANPILQRDRQLAGSLHHTATATRATVGVSKIYAAIHQFGGTAGMAPGPAAIPPRPYLPLTADGALLPAAAAEVLEILRRSLADAVG